MGGEIPVATGEVSALQWGWQLAPAAVGDQRVPNGDHAIFVGPW